MNDTFRRGTVLTNVEIIPQVESKLLQKVESFFIMTTVRTVHSKLSFKKVSTLHQNRKLFLFYTK